ncbi:MAG: transporter large permease, partial [Ramlibacter sp.]|nr:transporter large permease [Ramlibacter sp.]
IAKLFAAAMIPGILAMLGYMTAIAIYVRLVPGQAPEVDDAPRLTREALTGVIPIALIFLLVFGGIYGGLFTPTEGAAVGAAATFLAALAKREMTWQKFKHCFYATAEGSAMIFMIFIGADVLNSALALTQIQTQLVSVVSGWQVSPIWIMVGIVVLHLLLGTVTEELSIILLTIPIFFPLVMSLDFGMAKEPLALWFGILILMVVSFGMLVPPMGLNVYVVNGMARGVPLSETFRGVLPFLVSDFVRIGLILAFPGIALWLVRFMA